MEYFGETFIDVFIKIEMIHICNTSESSDLPFTMVAYEKFYF